MLEECVERRRRAASCGFALSSPAVWLLLCLPVCWDEALADGFNSDRPGFEVSSQLVPVGHVQLETGVGVQNNVPPRGDNYWNVPVLLRYGAGENWEMRLETDGLIVGQYDAQTGRSVTGYADVTLGTKWLLHADSGGIIPAMALVTDATIGTGSPELRGGGVRPGMRLELEWALPDDGTLGVMPGFVYDENDLHRFARGMLGIAYSRLWTQQFGTFLEVAGEQFAHGVDGGNIITYGGGGTYLVGETVQFDFSVSRGADRNAAAWTYGAGVSIRF